MTLLTLHYTSRALYLNNAHNTSLKAELGPNNKMTTPSNVLGSILLLSSCYIQQILVRAKYKHPKQPPSPQAWGKFAAGCLLELASLFLLPLPTYALLSSAHILFALPFELNANTLCMILGCLVVFFFGPSQGQVLHMDEFDGVFNGFYLLWMLCSLGVNLALRRLGFYAGRPILEASIPAQLSTFALGATKIFFLLCDAQTFSQAPLPIYLLCLAVAGIGAQSSAAFSRILCKQHDYLLVMCSYYLWVICYTVPLAVAAIYAGDFYSPTSCFSVFFSSALLFVALLRHSWAAAEATQLGQHQ